MDKEEEWAGIVKSIRNCKACPLYKFRKNPVPGEGSLNATVMLIGEAPGRREDETGRPFVGAAGKYLNELLSKAGLSREEVFITNVVKCRPPNNRDPEPEEILKCSQHTDRIIRLVSPKVIVTLGNHSGKYIIEYLGGRKWHGVTRARGRVYDLMILGLRVRVIPTYHPAAALYNPRLKSTIEQDFIRLGKELLFLKSGGRERTLLDYLT